MKKKVCGFTLAELMLSLGIVSIVAALTLPELTLHVSKNTMTASLARTLDQIEYAGQNIFHALNEYNEENDIVSNTDILYPIVMKEIIKNPTANGNANIFTEGTFDETLINYFGVTKITDNGKSKTSKFKDYDGGDLSGDDADEVSGYLADTKAYKVGKTAAEIYAVNIVPDDVDSSESYVLFVCVDTNGDSKGPNRFGRDLFAFKLRNDAKVIPYGDADECVKGNVQNGISCSARIVKDGFEVKYY